MQFYAAIVNVLDTAFVDRIYHRFQNPLIIKLCQKYCNYISLDSFIDSTFIVGMALKNTIASKGYSEALKQT